ncbi:6281_t:CDS:2 [Ambispora gerdemannii]|uniref:6281_t:CDS:1 n=1 Tax=Ambispora gerdemannii TaxID=144530 RepID=A0A9N8VSP5_9GLOM|nr:6281_t:CDS:2 [Ambispora gerdemannii]
MTIKRKVIILTGGNSGLGYEALKQFLTHQTPYHIILPVRNPTSAQPTFSELEVPKQHIVESTKLDLASFDSVWTFVSWFLQKGLRLHILILNAGVVFTELGKTADDYERTFQINHLSTFLLAQLLLPHLLISGPGSRIVFVNSALAGRGEGPKLEVDNLDGSKKYDGMLFYRNSKLIQMLCAYHLDKILEKEVVKVQGEGGKIEEKRKVTVVTLDPGFVPSTNLYRGYHWFLKFLMRSFVPFTRTPQQGGTVIVKSSISPTLENRNASWVNEYCGIARSSDESYDEEKQQYWWDLTCDIVGLKDKKSDHS